jgi:hypothetical protein
VVLLADDGLQVYFAKFGLDASEFLGGLEKSSGGIVQFYRDVSVSLGATMFIFDKMMAYSQRFIALANAAMEVQSAIDKLTVTTGMSTTELYRWSNVARYADSDINSLAFMIRKLTVSIKDTGTAGDEARAMLDGMHVSLKNADGSARSMNDVFPDVIGGLKGIEDAGTRNTAAMTLFGRSFQELSGYMLMSKSEMQGYFDEGFAPTSEQQQKLRDYEQALKDLNTTTGKVATEGGIALSGSLREWTDLMNSAFTDDSPILSFFEMLDGFLTLAARGLHIMSAEATAAYKGMFLDFAGQKATLDELGDWVQKKTRDDKLRAAGFRTDGNGNAIAEKEKAGVSDFVLPSDTKSTKENLLTTTEILAKQNQLAIKTLDVKSATKEYTDLLKTGDRTQSDFNDKLERSRLRMEGLKLEAADLATELQKAGAAVTAASGGTTYNQQFASSLQTGGVGPDYAGFSDLASMSQSELEGIAAGGLGKSKAMADKARQYLSMMSGANGSATESGTAGKKDLTPGSPDQTKSIETEYDIQIKALETLTNKTAAEYQKQTDAFRKHLDAMAEYRAQQYPALESQDFTHWVTSEEIAKVAVQKQLDFMAAAVNFGGMNPIIQNYIVMSAKGPDWTPPTFSGIVSPKLESADFTQVGSAVQGIVAKGLGEGTSAGMKIEYNQTVYATEDTASTKVQNATIKGISRAAAGITGLGGQMI